MGLLGKIAGAMNPKKVAKAVGGTMGIGGGGGAVGRLARKAIPNVAERVMTKGAGMMKPGTPMGMARNVMGRGKKKAAVRTAGRR
jgi:hypothetical protein